MKKTEKSTIIADIQKDLSGATGLFFLKYNAITVKEISQLRRNLRAGQAKIKVLKNTLLKRALAEAKAPDSAELLTGQTALAWTKGDLIMTIKALVGFAPEKGQWEVKGGIIEGRPTSAGDLKKLSKLPSREVLLSQLVRNLNAPISNLVYVLGGLSRQLVLDLNEIKKNKEVKQ